MKRLFKLTIALVILFSGICLSIPNRAIAEDIETAGSLNIYLFYGEGCPHCAKEREYLNEIKGKYQDKISIHEYEVYYNPDNSELLFQAAKHLNTEVAGVPFLIIGGKHFVGYDSDQNSGAEISKEIDKCLNNGCKDNLSKLLLGEVRGKNVSNTDNTTDDNSDTSAESEEDSPIYLNTYIFGEINLKDTSLPIATILVGLMDGFNPCAMWILIFLLTMLINMKDRKKLYILGSIFIFVSGAVYFVFLAAWFNFFRLIGYTYWIKAAIGVVAIVCGAAHIRNSILSNGVCHVTNVKQKQTIMSRIKKILAKESFLLAILGISVLAVSVNIIELFCSAGLPAIYTNLLSTINLSTFEYYAYLLLYTAFFMLDDLVVFFIAVKTFEVTKITQKYTKWSGIIGGIIIFIIGIILIVKPGLLMFG